MKKAKLLLLIISAFSLIGGSYAFKLKRGGIIYTRAANTTLCTVTLQGFTTRTVLPGQLPVSTTYLSTTTGTCPVTLEYYTEA
jgi:hypothetical protein